MYTITQTQKEGLDYVELTGATSKASICLSRGAALETLTLNNISLLAGLHPLSYKDTYASSILFPFANRIKDGKYTYNNQTFQLECNEENLNNALHGLVYNQLFQVADSKVATESASVTLTYENNKPFAGFPYFFLLAVTYTLSEKGLELQLKVTNKDPKAFPFTLGWHPYFLSDDLYKSSLTFKSNKTIAFDERMITKKVVDDAVHMPLEIKDQQLDNCYVLSDSKVVFKTPKYQMMIDSTASENFFQMYTPPVKNAIALEPVTGVSDSFNNQMGVQELPSGASYQLAWSIKI